MEWWSDGLGDRWINGLVDLQIYGLFSLKSTPPRWGWNGISRAYPQGRLPLAKVWVRRWRAAGQPCSCQTQTR